ncbi:PepSY-associated TM helix domain-containing protein [Flavobacterium sp.]|uniref:PepSY-associated TM helix domain-containing protein n=1 Tax=Flavobacterium sp. TaxID=239 RepID=UPI0028BE077A|nr:PepSY-associated TM helix domain-containing protein [Flavobacterium sp.]
MKKRNKNIRAIHREFGYFYLGLIISFAFSGILMNHRDSWHPEKYTTQTKEITVQLPSEDAISEKFAENLGKELGVEDKFRRHSIKKGALRISYENTDVEIDLESGKGEIVSFLKTPIISQTMKLHKNTSNWWIYYSDVFGLSLITIAVTGAMMITAGKNTFKRRGWKLALAGIIFPLIFLLFLA